MIIRKASAKDSIYIAPLLLLAMEDIIYTFINKTDYDTALNFLSYFVQKENNQYSYQNCFVAEKDNIIIGAVNLYDGAKLQLLRQPVIDYVKDNYNSNFNPEDETQKGEYYIDTLGVSPAQQGQGTGSKMLHYLIDKYAIKNKHVLGLLVEEDKPDAKKLYLKLGFKVVGKKKLAGKNLDHLQIAFPEAMIL